jgi:GNAT superfamily N-acetyltransferase
MAPSEIVWWEARDPDDPVLDQARQLYETTLDPAERIPWAWIAEATRRPSRWGDGWSPHLLLAAPGAGPGPREPVIGFAYGIHLSGYGGYACYLGVEPGHRRRGVATRLLQALFQVIRDDAAAEGTPLPFVVWESRQPPATAPADEAARWQARLRLFERVGAWWVAGLTFLAPNFARRGGPAVPLQLFLVPVDVPPAAFDAKILREVAAGLMRRVYNRREGDRLFDQTLATAGRLTLQPVAALRTIS